MNNEGLWLLAMTLGIVCMLWAARQAPVYLIDALIIMPVAMNLQVGKLMPLWGKVLPGGDMLAVAFGLGMNLVAYHQGADEARRCLHRASFVLMVWFVLMSIHALFLPFHGDPLTLAHQQVMVMIPRVCLASWCAFYVAQSIERSVFSFMVVRWGMGWAHATSCALAQCVDTVLFSGLAFYGQAVLWDQVILWSLWIKLLGGALTSLVVWGVYGHEGRISL